MRPGRALRAAQASCRGLPLAPSGRLLEIERGAELGAVEPSVTAWRRQRWAQPAIPDSAVQRRLADPEQPGGLPGRDEPRTLRLVLELGGEGDDIVLAEPAVPARGDERGMEQSSRYRAQNCRLADTEATCHILRTDQSVQDVCWSNAA